ncbi:hypothetical protein WJX77_007230 [Trebouxia sp. C0004]
MADSNKRQKTLLSFFALPKHNKAADQLFIAPHPGHFNQDNQEAWDKFGVALARGKQKSGQVPSADAPTHGYVALPKPLTDQTPTLSQPLPDISPVDTHVRVEHTAARKSDKQKSHLLLCVDSTDPAASDTDNEGSLHKINMSAEPTRSLENVNAYEEQGRGKRAFSVTMRGCRVWAYSIWHMYLGSTAAELYHAQPVESADLQGNPGGCESVPKMYDESSVITYVCQVQSPSRSKLPKAASSGMINGFSELPGWLSDSKLVRAYSMDVQGSLLAAGGKNGHAAVFGIQRAMAGQEGETAPLLSAKLHKSWIADVQLLSAAPFGEQEEKTDYGSEVVRLLTASNDGSVSLWDLSKCCDGRPLEAAHTDTLHTGGIWSMHCHGRSIATASKDCSVVISSLDAAESITAVQSYEQQHAGAVKCVRWRDNHTLASCGNDMSIKVIDTRSRTMSQDIQDAHDGCVNCVRWHPRHPSLLLSTGTDPCLHLWDLRHTKQALHTFCGHTVAARCSQIYQANFVADGTAIACGGPKSLQLSLYCCSSNRTISRGDLGFEPMTMLSVGTTLFCATSKQVIVYHENGAAVSSDEPHQ